MEGDGGMNSGGNAKRINNLGMDEEMSYMYRERERERKNKFKEFCLKGKRGILVMGVTIQAQQRRVEGRTNTRLRHLIV